jgi:thiamine biosynthesis lipoprotein
MGEKMSRTLQRGRNRKQEARKQEARKQEIKNIICPLLCFFTSLLLCLLASSSFAQSSGEPKQFQQRFNLKNGTSGVIVIIGWPADSGNIEKLAQMVVDETNRTFDLLDAGNPASDVSKLNSGAGNGPVKVSWQVVDAFKAASQVSGWTNGAFDVVSSNGDYRDISIDADASTVELKKAGMQVKFDPIIDGYLADYMINLIHTAKMQNAMVKVGNVFRGIGQSLYGPWKIQVQEDSAAYARHALNLTVSNTGIATISATQFRASPLIDFRSKQTVRPGLKGATIIMKEAAHAQGIAYAVFVMGPSEGINFLNRFGKARGLIVDAQGKFLKTPGL